MATGPASSIQVPHDFYADSRRVRPPGPGRYATGLAFLSRHPHEAEAARTAIGKLAGEEGLEVIGWRDVPIHDATLGSIAEAAMPSIHQLFVAPSPSTALTGDDPGLAVDRLAYILRKRAEHEIDQCYLVSLSARTITYKGMLTSHQLAEFFPTCPTSGSSVDWPWSSSRFSTNTFPSWPLAHPYRYLAHNGEINTLAGNRNWMRARRRCAPPPSSPGWSGPSPS